MVIKIKVYASINRFLESTGEGLFGVGVQKKKMPFVDAQKIKKSRFQRKSICLIVINNNQAT